MSQNTELQIFHNPRCSKSRQTLALLEEKGLQPTIIEYLKQPPTAAELGSILQQLGMNPRQLLRTGEAEYKAAGMDNNDLSDQALIELMVANPKVIERPIVITNGKAKIGRPPESVLEIL